jgi:hypothetical protein
MSVENERLQAWLRRAQNGGGGPLVLPGEVDTPGWYATLAAAEIRAKGLSFDSAKVLPAAMGRDRLVASVQIGGTAHEGDRRILLPEAMLHGVLACARESGVKQAMIVRAGLKVDRYIDAFGRPYEVWTFNGAGPVPVRSPLAR